ncbi:MAG: mechanosensitive ion channel domain-containing protein, partial [Pseudomonadota bacterium]|nr:mechanosensitive ion channel domain-containing protein [Pseudomonadota bacterium]
MSIPTNTPSGETYDQTVNTLATLQDQLVDMAEGFVRALPNMAIALVIILITWIVARIAVRGVSRAIGKTDMRPSLQNLIDTVVKLGIWIIGLMIALIVVMPGMTPASLIAGLGIGAVAIGFAFQDIFENFLAGVLIMLREKMRIGDIIECEGIIGKVEHITLRETHVRKLSGEVT